MKKTKTGKTDIEEKQKEDLSKLEEQLKEVQEEKPKRKRGRPPKKKPEEELPSPPLQIDLEPEFVLFFLEAPFEKLAEKRGEHWRLQEDEKQRLSELVNKLLEKYSKYIPVWIAKYGLEITTVSYIFFLIQKRIMKDKALQAVEQKEEQQATEQGQ